MSRFDDLIARHCPSGVPFVALCEIGEFTRGRRFTKKDMGDAGLPCIHYGEIYTHYGTWTLSTISHVRSDLRNRLRFARPGDVVVVGVGETVEDVGKAVAWLGSEEVAVHDDCYALHHDQNPKYIAYAMQVPDFHAQKNKYVARAKVKRLSGEGLSKIKIPLPPLAVQKEIVRVLDQFAELEVELEVELEARRKQYTHYRDSMLAFNDDREVRRIPVGDACTQVLCGGTPLSTQPEYYGGRIPWLRTQEVRYSDILHTKVTISKAGLENSAARWVPANSVIVAISGAGVTRGRIAVNRIPLTTNQHCCSLVIDPLKAHYRFVYHWLAARYEDLRSRGQGNRSDLNVGIIKAFKMPLPSLEEQARIVGILDKFDALVNDLSVGLPAEIRARRQQYEYYRDQLLTFEEAP